MPLGSASIPRGHAAVAAGRQPHGRRADGPPLATCDSQPHRQGAGQGWTTSQRPDQNRPRAIGRVYGRQPLAATRREGDIGCKNGDPPKEWRLASDKWRPSTSKATGTEKSGDDQGKRATGDPSATKSGSGDVERRLATAQASSLATGKGTLRRHVDTPSPHAQNPSANGRAPGIRNQASGIRTATSVQSWRHRPQAPHRMPSATKRLIWRHLATPAALIGDATECLRRRNDSSIWRHPRAKPRKHLP